MSTDRDALETVEILRIAPGGDGVGRLSSGETVFVGTACRGDVFEIESTKRVQGVRFAERYRLVTPGPERRAAPCPHATTCGGCDFMQLPPEVQRREKLSMLEDALVRIGGDPQRPEKVAYVPSESDRAYRSRVRLHIDKNGYVGYHSDRSNRVVPIEQCLIAVPLINEVIAQLRQLDETNRRRLTFCSQIELRVSDDAPHLSVRLIPRKGVTLRADVYVPLFPAGTLVVVADSPDDKQLGQSIAVTDEVTLQVPVAAFSQVNRAVNRRLVQAVVEGATLRNHKSFLDAYAGAGNFALPLLKAGLVGEAVDQGDAGILAARSVARDLGLPFSGFSIGDARRLIEQFVKNKRRFDYVVLDPPRKGSKDVLEQCLRLHPHTIALIGCDPVSFARDLGQLVRAGCTIESITVFDMFPETHHSETLAIVDTNDQEA
jgi:23S rRNA (uracil1939-C5)-methyltransferase